MKIICSAHSIARFRERFRLQFNKEIFQENRESYMLKKLFSSSIRCDFALMQRPGDYNALCIARNGKVEHFQNGKMIFCTKLIDNNTRMITTILRTPCNIGPISLK